MRWSNTSRKIRLKWFIKLMHKITLNVISLDVVEESHESLRCCHFHTDHRRASPVSSRINANFKGIILKKHNYQS